ncbi:nucleotidyltransferase family protein [Erythrobacter mangrovi]|uniref:nucleotidyltransferase family protein n=1 Tax=Erythrobacter mangrovi TaxID=2739433 RepID=UPI001F41D086|nr:nucleotidyltransferase family protein [Erythrobacter mangrovi]
MPRLAVALLAAGQSRRFGGDKLAAGFRGKMLGLHAADALAQLAFAHRWVSVSDPEHPCVPGWVEAGFNPVPNPDAAQGMGTSVALAGRLAKEAKIDQLLIALADMPLVPHAHFVALLAKARIQGEAALVASTDGTAAMPPAVFGSAHFDRLVLASGDKGARALLGAAELVAAPQGTLADVDDEATLRALG